MTEKSVFHISSILLMAESPFKSNLMIHLSSLEEVSELILAFGGIITLSIPNEKRSSYLTLGIKNGLSDVSAFCNMSNLSIMLQKEAFKSDTVILEKGTKVTIIDNQYFVI